MKRIGHKTYRGSVAVTDTPKGDPAAFVDHSAALIGITLESEVREAVIGNLRHFISLAAAVEGFEETGPTEPLAVFKP